MMTEFDSSYYGTVDMENLGYAGTPINERRYSQAELGDALQHHRAIEGRRTPLGTPLEVQLEDLDRFAKEVMPAFRQAKIAAAAE